MFSRCCFIILCILWVCSLFVCGCFCFVIFCFAQDQSTHKNIMDHTCSDTQHNKTHSTTHIYEASPPRKQKQTQTKNNNTHTHTPIPPIKKQTHCFSLVLGPSQERVGKPSSKTRASKTRSRTKNKQETHRH